MNSIKLTLDSIDVHELRGRIKEHVDLDQNKQKECYDQSRRVAPTYPVGDLERVRISSESNTGCCKKLLPKYKGAIRIIGELSNDRYEVEDLRECQKRPSGWRTVIATDHLERWITMVDNN